MMHAYLNFKTFHIAISSSDDHICSMIHGHSIAADTNHSSTSDLHMAHLITSLGTLSKSFIQIHKFRFLPLALNLCFCITTNIASVVLVWLLDVGLDEKLNRSWLATSPRHFQHHHITALPVRLQQTFGHITMQMENEFTPDSGCFWRFVFSNIVYPVLSDVC